MMVTKRGKLDKSEGIRLPDGRIIRSIGDDVEGYKCLGMLGCWRPMTLCMTK